LLSKGGEVQTDQIDHCDKITKEPLNSTSYRIIKLVIVKQCCGFCEFLFLK